MSDNSQQAENLRQAMRAAGVQTPEYRFEIAGLAKLAEELKLKPGEITMKEEQDVVPMGDGEAVWLTAPRLVIRENGVPIGSISTKAPRVAALVQFVLADAETFARVRAGFGKIEGGQS